MSQTKTNKPSFIWRYLGAMMTEKKNGGMAASFTRVLGILTFALWITLILCLSFGVKVPELAIYTVTTVLMTFVAGKSVKDFGKALKGHSSYSSPQPQPATLSSAAIDLRPQPPGGLKCVGTTG